MTTAGDSGGLTVAGPSGTIPRPLPLAQTGRGAVALGAAALGNKGLSHETSDNNTGWQAGAYV